MSHWCHLRGGNWCKKEYTGTVRRKSRCLSGSKADLSLVKIKGNRAGLAESTNWFSENPHLTKHVRHIEVWVPVWADKRPEHQKTRFIDEPTNLIPAYLNSFHSSGPGLTISSTRDIYNQTNDLALHVNETNEGLFTYPFSNGTTSATLSEVFSHIAYFFSQAQIFTLEGGHCKKSRMIRQFPATLFPAPDRRLDVLPNIRTFAMRGAWNIMRDYGHWTVLERALPAVQEWHCAYAKPRPEAYTTINLILSHLPRKLRHVNISLDGFYCKDVIEGNGVLASSPQSTLPNRHLCERLGKIAPQLETLSFTGRICECFFRIATEVARTRKEASQLRAIDIVVKSCCRLMVVNKTPTETNGENGLGTEDGANEATSPDFPPTTTTTTAAAAAASALQALIPSPHSDTLTGITNMIFIRSFERLILSAVKSLDLSAFPSLAHIRIRFIDLDSACPLLNPYFVFSGPEGGRCAGVWNEEILEALWRTRPDAVGWEELGEGIERDWEGDGGLVKGGGGGVDGSSRISLIGSDGVGMMGVRRKPTAIRGSAYRNLAEAR